MWALSGIPQIRLISESRYNSASKWLRLSTFLPTFCRLWTLRQDFWSLQFMLGSLIPCPRTYTPTEGKIARYFMSLSGTVKFHKILYTICRQDTCTFRHPRYFITSFRQAKMPDKEHRVECESISRSCLSWLLGFSVWIGIEIRNGTKRKSFSLFIGSDKSFSIQSSVSLSRI